MAETVLITGASGGLGAEAARIFAREGCNLVLVARSGDKIKALKKELETQYKIKAEAVEKDLTIENAAREVFRFTAQKGIEVDVLVNNAGFGDFGAFANSDWDKQYAMIRLNIIALTELTHCFLKGMIERRRGKILNLASTAAFQAGPLMSVYYASKAFVLSFTEALSAELKGTGVTASVLCPGPTRTGFEKAANLENSGLFKNLKIADSRTVMEYGCKKMRKNKVVIIPGAANKALVFASKLSPRAVVRRVVYAIQRVR